MDYFKEYDPLAPEPVRKVKFNKIVDKQNSHLSQADREKAFKIVDAYIRADKGLNTDYKISEKDKQLISNLFASAEKQKEQGMQAMMSEVARYKNMSYSEFKNFITRNGQIPVKEADIKNTYNQMHKTDSKSVTVTAQDKQKTKQLTIIEAVDILQNPNKYNYTEFKAAMKLVQLNVSDEDIQKAWQKMHR